LYPPSSFVQLTVFALFVVTSLQKRIMADALYGATPYSFLPLYPPNDMTGDDTDYAGKYRAHAELFGSTRSAIPA
jgi:hypothetical protein